MKKKAEKKIENFQELEEKAKRLEALINLTNDIRDKEKREPIPFNDFLFFASNNPELAFRDIFQLLHDMVHYYVPKGKDNYPQSQETIGFVDYNSHNLFVNGCDEPFFADKLFTHRFMSLVDGFKMGIQNNRIYLFEGPPGSGKSTFLNNLLQKLEEFTKLPEGVMFKTFWRIDIDRFKNIKKFENQINQILQQNGAKLDSEFVNTKNLYSKHLDISCPCNDHPILQIPRDLREKFLDELIPDKEFKEKLFESKEYKWVLKDIPCSICNSIYNAILDEVEDPIAVFNMVNARKSIFNRQFGKGISIFNPGDTNITKPINNAELQNSINKVFSTDEIRYIYSILANTNNGVYALMDIKEHNVERLKDLHGIISDGVHKVELVEERIKSFFVGLVNPEDKIHYEKVKSFQDRIITVNIPYILDYKTEVAVYKNKLGDKIDDYFLPQVLENFAKIIISSRLDINTPNIKKWITNPEKYSKYVDKDLLLLKMDIYTNKVPTWLGEDDIQNFTRQIRKGIIEDSEDEGTKGFSGRQSLNIFNDFITKHAKTDKLITMNMVKDYFAEDNNMLNHEVSNEFMLSLVDLYDYQVIQEIKEAIYYYNESQIERDILNYLFAINFEIGTKEKCIYTNDLIEVTDDFFKNFEAIFIGTTSTVKERKAFRRDMHKEYISKTIAQEVKIEGKALKNTVLFQSLFDKYTRNLKENALIPYVDNDNFRRAILDFGNAQFKSYDDRIKRDISLMISNLKKKFKYSSEGAKQVSIYAIDKNLAKKY